MSLVLNPPGVTGKEGTSIQRLARNTKIPLHKQEKSQGKRIIKEKTKVWEGCPEYCYQNRFSFSLQELSHESYIKGVATKIEYKEKKKPGKHPAHVWASDVRWGQKRRHWCPHWAVAAAAWTPACANVKAGCLMISRRRETQKTMLFFHIDMK